MEIQFCFRTVGSGTKYHVLYYMWTFFFFFFPRGLEKEWSCLCSWNWMGCVIMCRYWISELLELTNLVGDEIWEHLTVINVKHGRCLQSFFIIIYYLMYFKIWWFMFQRFIFKTACLSVTLGCILLWNRLLPSMPARSQGMKHCSMITFSKTPTSYNLLNFLDFFLWSINAYMSFANRMLALSSLGRFGNSISNW